VITWGLLSFNKGEAMNDHPIANIFPLLPDLTELSGNIKEQGLLEPIIVYEGQILDGRNRYRACGIAGIEPITTEFTGTQVQALEMVWGRNKARRHLSPSQAAIAAAKYEQAHNHYAPIKEAAKDRQREGGKEKVVALMPQPKTRDLRATDAGVSPKYIHAADRIVQERPDLAVAIETGSKTITQVQREMKQEEARVVPIPEGEYRVLYVDPPWKYSDQMKISKDGIGESYGPADAHYPQMTITELCDLKVPAAENSVLFMWTTSPLLEDAFKVIKAWRFNYKASFVWDKIKHNMGHYNSVRHEFLLVCTRGSCLPDVKKLFDSVVSVERTEHSEKPEHFRDIIDTLYTEGGKIELFARNKAEGWESF
jgi:N6-adenosine-specific RNA methylase IME4